MFVQNFLADTLNLNEPKFEFHLLRVFLGGLRHDVKGRILPPFQQTLDGVRGGTPAHMLRASILFLGCPVLIGEVGLIIVIVVPARSLRPVAILE